MIRQIRRKLQDVTLIEIFVVIAIVAILAAVIIGAATNHDKIVGSQYDSAGAFHTIRQRQDGSCYDYNNNTMGSMDIPCP